MSPKYTELYKYGYAKCLKTCPFCDEKVRIESHHFEHEQYIEISHESNNPCKISMKEHFTKTRSEPNVVTVREAYDNVVKRWNHRTKGRRAGKPVSPERPA